MSLKPSSAKYFSRELPLLVDVIVAIGRKHQNGDGGLMEQEHSVTPVAYVCLNTLRGFNFTNISSDYAKLTRKMGSKSSSTGSNLRPKEASPA